MSSLKCKEFSLRTDGTPTGTELKIDGVRQGFVQELNVDVSISGVSINMTKGYPDKPAEFINVELERGAK